MQAIRKKAIQLIVKEGLDGFSMQKLARSAGVSPATLYIYYKDKEDLILQIYLELGKNFRELMLKDFDPSMNFREGLRIQWMNRANVHLKYPLEAQFMEQIRYAPQFAKASKELNESFGEVLEQWVKNAIARKEVIAFPGIEIFWSVVYAPLYQLIRFQQTGAGMLGQKFVLTNMDIESTLDLVVKAVTPEPSKS